MLWQGIVLGLTLSFLIGPLLFAIVQASLERGFRAGLAVGAGIWIGDVLYVLAIHRALDELTALTAWPQFRFWAALAGGTLLAAFGVGNLVRAGRRAGASPQPLTDEEPNPVAVRPRSYGAYALHGFLINLVNPFTVFFWLGIATGVVVPNNWTPGQSIVFFTGMLGTLVVTDSLKALAAKAVRRWLTPAHTRAVQRVIGVLLVVFGVVMIYRGAGM